MNRNLYFFRNTINRDLQAKFPLRKNGDLKLNSITLHLSLRDQKFQGEEYLLSMLLALEVIGGKKPYTSFSRRSISHLFLKRGFLSGVSICLRSNEMYNFLEELRTEILPNINGFEGISIKSLDTKGNLGFRLENLIRFPAIEERYLHFQRGNPQAASSGKYLPLDISFHTSAKNLEEGKALLSAFQLPVNI